MLLKVPSTAEDLVKGLADAAGIPPKAEPLVRLKPALADHFGAEEAQLTLGSPILLHGCSIFHTFGSSNHLRRL